MSASTSRDGTSVSGWAEASDERREHAVPGAIRAARRTSESHGTFISVIDAPPGIRGGELSGLPFAVKDNIDVAGMRTTAGSPMFDGAPVDIDAGVVSVLRDAGAVVVGKTNMHELAFGITSNNAAFGPVRNPFDRTRSAGGSSGGSAAAVALGVVPFAIGTDTGGSVTIPSAFCGIVGFRPSTGRYPADGLINLSTTRDTAGLHARSVADVRHLDRIITRSPGESERPLERTRVGVLRSRFVDIDPDIADAAERMLDRLREADITVIDADIPDDIASGGAGIELVLYESHRLITARAAELTDARVRFADLVAKIASNDVRDLAQMIAADPLSADAYEAARAVRWDLRRRYAVAFEEFGVDAFVAPTCPVLPPSIGEDQVVELNGTDVPVFATVTRNSAPGTVAGVPMLTLPVGTSRTGLPIGMTLEGAFFADDALLSLASQMEQLGFE